MESLLSDYTFASRYANYLPESSRRERWPEAAQRVFDMHRRRYPKMDLDEIQQAFLEKKILGSQRALQFGGVPMEKINARGYNCCGSFADRPRFFSEAFWLLLCGCGVGFSVQWHHVAQLPRINKPTLKDAVEFVIPDSIEGWADAAYVLILSYFTGGRPIRFVYDQIRPKGSAIGAGVGKAPGPEPLRRALERVREVLDRSGERLRPIEVYDIVMFLSQAVLSGGVRRSATICIFSPDDTEMMLAKTGDWWKTNPQRARSNNSAVLLRGKTPFRVFQKLIDASREYGDPGVYWVDHLDTVPNPCLEISFNPVTPTGQSGWQFCNLSVVNGSNLESFKDFMVRCELAAQLGTLQAGYTDFGYLGSASRVITEREALIGVSITGVQQRPQFCLDPATLRAGAREVIRANEEWAQLIGINQAARATALKPEGTSSCLLGPVASGAHRPEGLEDEDGKVRFIRSVQATANEPAARAFAEVNPVAVERTRRVGDEDTDDLILSFAMEMDGPGKSQSAVEFLQDVKTLKQNWIDEGKVAGRCSRPDLSNNVSNTVTVREDEWGEVAREIFEHQDVYCGVSLLGSFSDLAVAQAPFVACRGDGERSEVRARWERLRRESVPVDYASIREDSDGTSFSAEPTCAGGSCLV